MFLAFFVVVFGGVCHVLATWPRWLPFEFGLLPSLRADAATATVAGGGIDAFCDAC